MTPFPSHTHTLRRRYLSVQRTLKTQPNAPQHYYPPVLPPGPTRPAAPATTTAAAPRASQLLLASAHQALDLVGGLAQQALLLLP
jgi:hypothetical protein